MCSISRIFSFLEVLHQLFILLAIILVDTLHGLEAKIDQATDKDDEHVHIIVLLRQRQRRNDVLGYLSLLMGMIGLSLALELIIHIWSSHLVSWRWHLLSSSCIHSQVLCLLLLLLELLIHLELLLELLKLSEVHLCRVGLGCFLLRNFVTFHLFLIVLKI